MSSIIAVEYYNKKFGDDRSAAFIHLVREIGEIAFAMEKNNVEHAKMEITDLPHCSITWHQSIILTLMQT